jgi:hypothetical protein
MDQNTLYAMSLGLPAPWKVVSSEFRYFDNLKAICYCMANRLDLQIPSAFTPPSISMRPKKYTPLANFENRNFSSPDSRD